MRWVDSHCRCDFGGIHLFQLRHAKNSGLVGGNLSKRITQTVGKFLCRQALPCLEFQTGMLLVERYLYAAGAGSFANRINCPPGGDSPEQCQRMIDVCFGGDLGVLKKGFLEAVCSTLLAAQEPADGLPDSRPVLRDYPVTLIHHGSAIDRPESSRGQALGITKMRRWRSPVHRRDADAT